MGISLQVVLYNLKSQQNSKYCRDGEDQIVKTRKQKEFSSGVGMGFKRCRVARLFIRVGMGNHITIRENMPVNEERIVERYHTYKRDLNNHKCINQIFLKLFSHLPANL